MSNHMFKTEKISSRLDAQGNLVVESVTSKSIIETCPGSERVEYRRLPQ